MNGNYPAQPGNYPAQPGYTPQPPPRQGMGCFAKGCLTVVAVCVILLVIFGIVGWRIYRGVSEFVSTEPIAIRTASPSDAQYQDVTARCQDFVNALNAGHAATLTISADDLNTLIARDSELSDLKGKVFLSIINNQLVAEASFPIKDAMRSGRQIYYFGGKLILDASFARSSSESDGGDFTFIPRKVETIEGKPAPTLVSLFVNNPEMARGMNEGFNKSFKEELRKNDTAWEGFVKLHTIVIQDNHIVITSSEGEPSAHPIGAPSRAPVATPSPTE